MRPIQYLIANPVAGGGRARIVLPRVMALLQARGHRPQMLETRGRGHGRELAAALPPSAGVAVLGGDGTFNEVVNGLRSKGCALLLLPCGNGNDLARSLRLSLDPLAIAASAVTREVTIDLGEIDGHLFANNAGVGLDGEICRLMQACPGTFRGRGGYVRAFVACALNLRASPFHLRFDGAVQRDRGLLLTFSNGQYYGGGMRIAPEACLDDGLLDICAVLEIARLPLFRAFPRIYSGSHVSHPRFRLWRARAAAVHGVRPLSMHADGEVVGRLSTDPARPTIVRIAVDRQCFLIPDQPASGWRSARSRPE